MESSCAEALTRAPRRTAGPFRENFPQPTIESPDMLTGGSLPL